jgi:LPS-assembly lipoprotein
MSWSERAPAAGAPGAPDDRRRACTASLGALAVGCVAAAAGLLGGCGFALRQPPRLTFRSLALAGFEPRSPLADELRRQIGAQVALLDDPQRAEVVLQALADQRQKSVVASTAAAQVRELQLRLRFEFRLSAPGGRELMPRVQLLLTRDMSYSETSALAKEQEEAELFRDMQADVVAQVMRRLASIRL